MANFIKEMRNLSIDALEDIKFDLIDKNNPADQSLLDAIAAELRRRG